MLGFFYNGEYYLLPKDFSSFEQFSTYIHKKLNHSKKVKVCAKHLCEKKCLAPFFTEENVVAEKIEITNPDFVFPANVEVMPQKSYNQNLRKLVLERCPGCLLYTPIDESDESLEGHHEEMCLDGECFFRQENKDPFYSLYYGLESFCAGFKQKQAIIEDLVNRNELELACDTINFLIEPKLGFKPHAIKLFKQKGTYYCCFPCFLDLNLGLIYRYVCQFFNLEKIKNWKFLPYLPKGALKENLPMPQIKFIVNNKQLQKIDIVVPDIGKAREAYLALCNAFGEDSFLAAYSRAWIKFETKSYGVEIPPHVLERDINLLIKEFYPGQKEISLPCERPFSKSSIDGKKIRSALCRSNLFFVASDNEQEIFGDMAKTELQTNLFTEYGISVAKLTLVCDGFKNGKAVDGLFENVLDNNYSMLFAKEYGQTFITYYLLITNKRRFFAAIKKYAPTFDTFKPSLSIFEENSFQIFDLSKHINAEQIKNSCERKS